MEGKVIHVAGFPVRVGSECKQVCAWCGLVLADLDYRSTAQPAGQTGDPWHPFEMGALVDVQKDGPRTLSAVVPHEDGKPMPAGFCGDEGKARLRLMDTVL